MWPVIGHETVVAYLERSLEKGALAHAYLFTGVPHVGKMTLAQTLAQALNCESAQRPCGACPQCQRIANLSHPDVQVLRPLSGGEASDGRTRTEITIEQIRDIWHWASLPPYQGRWRVFIIEQAELLSLEAANCLLKTLEEPLPCVLFILLAAEPQRLLETVVSRCQRLELHPVSLGKIEEALLARGLEPKRVGLLSRLCHGAPGVALRAVEDESWFIERQDTLGRLIDLVSADYEERFDCAAELAGRFSQDRAGVLVTLELWGGLWRDLLLAKAGAAEAMTNLDFSDRLVSLAGFLSLAEISLFLNSLRLAERRLRQNASPRLVLEVLMLDAPRVDRHTVG